MIIGANIISAATGGSLSGTISQDNWDVLTPSDALLNSPAYITSQYIIQQSIGDMTSPEDSDDWPLFVSFLPDGRNVKDNCGVLYDTSGFKDGRYMVNGAVTIHHGIQLKIRSTSHSAGWMKAQDIALSLDATKNKIVTIVPYEYTIMNISRSSDIMSLGLEEGSNDRRSFTVNFTITLKRNSL